MKMILALLFASSLGGGVTLFGLWKGPLNSRPELELYKKHHAPKVGSYYSVEAIPDPIGGKNFIIGNLVRPELGGSVSKVGGLVEIEVPSNKAGSKNGAYLTIRKNAKTGVVETVYFFAAEHVVMDALEH